MKSKRNVKKGIWEHQRWMPDMNSIRSVRRYNLLNFMNIFLWSLYIYSLPPLPFLLSPYISLTHAGTHLWPVRPCERWPVPCFVVSRNLKHGQLRYFQMYQKYRVKIVSKFWQNTHSKSNFYRIYNYDNGMQGLNGQFHQPYSQISCTFISCAES